MTWTLYLDDEREPPKGSTYTVARSTAMAVYLCVKRGSLPTFMSLDHDLGEDDNTMRFLNEIYHLWEEHGSDLKSIPGYQVHSANPVGAKNIIAFMESWKKSASL